MTEENQSWTVDDQVSEVMTQGTSSINAKVYIKLLNTFLIPSVKRMFGDDDIIFSMIIQCATGQRTQKLASKKYI